MCRLGVNANSVIDVLRMRRFSSIVLSGGVRSTCPTAVGQVLGTSAETIIELNLRIRNSAVTEFAFTPKRHMVLSFNHLPHLDAVERREWVSYS